MRAEGPESLLLQSQFRPQALGRRAIWFRILIWTLIVMFGVIAVFAVLEVYAPWFIGGYRPFGPL